MDRAGLGERDRKRGAHDGVLPKGPERGPPSPRVETAGLGSACVAPAVFGLRPETFGRESGKLLNPTCNYEDQSAGRRLERPGQSRSPVIEAFRRDIHTHNWDIKY